MTPAESPPLLVILGPTGTGKSETALRVAETLSGEVVGCDALQVYRDLEIGTAKPSREHRARVRHHLVDVVDPREDFSMAAYVRAAERAIGEIRSRGRLPVVVGGTGLYLRALLCGFIDAPDRNAELRRRLQAIAMRRGPVRLHRWLGRLDPVSVRRIQPTDRQRLVRALELALGGGTPWSERLREAGTWAGGRERYGCLKVGLDMERERLGALIDARVERFFQDGLVAEVQHLLRQGVPPSANAFKAIGYRQVLAAMAEERDAEGVRDEVKRETRRYAKRQRTWFRKEPAVVWLDAAAGPEVLADRVVGLWRAWRAQASTSSVHDILAAEMPRDHKMAEASMEAETRNLQNDFFNAARKERTIVTVFLGNGKKLTGRIKSFDKFTLLLDSPQGEQIVFKHAISTVSAYVRSASAGDEPYRRPRDSDASRPRSEAGE